MFVTHKEATKSLYLPDFPQNNSQKETCLDDDVKMTPRGRLASSDLKLSIFQYLIPVTSFSMMTFQKANYIQGVPKIAPPPPSRNHSIVVNRVLLYI